MKSLIAELRRRNVLRFGTAYALAGWILIEAGSVLLPTFGAPDWVFKTYAIAVIAGVPVAAIFAWVFELTPEGLKRTEEVPAETSVAPATRRKLDFVIIGMLAVALAISVALNLSGVREVEVVSGTTGSGARQSIAVLPFTSRSTDPENAIFADGVHDDLLTTLTNIGALKVISRTSVMEYRDTTKKLRQIGEELGVETVLEGSVQRSGDTVRINVQLIDAATDEHLWAHIYDRELSAKNIFAIQSEISHSIAGELKATLSPEEQDRIEAVPTENLEAYNYYLAGRGNLAQRKLTTLTQARKLFEQAIALDSNFAMAYGGLADSLLLLFINHQAITEEEAFTGARAAIERALALDPGLADAFASLGLLEHQLWSRTRSGPGLDAASEAFRRAIELNPNHARAYMWYANVFQELGDDEKVIEYLTRALELDPLARIPQTSLALQYAREGRNEQALQRWLKATRLHPDWPNPYTSISGHLGSLGRLDEAMAWSLRALELSTDPLRAGNVVGISMEFRQPERAVAFLDGIPSGHPLAGLGSAFTTFVLRDFAGALDAMQAQLDVAGSPRGFLLPIAATAAMLAGEYAVARDYLQEQSPQLVAGEVDRFNAANAVSLAFVLQHLGDDERAALLLGRAGPVIAALPRLGTAGHGISDVHVLSLSGRDEEALVRLREAVDEGFRGGWMFYLWRLAEDPFLEGLRDDERFQAIVAEVEADLARQRDRVARAEASGDWQPLLSLASGQSEIALTNQP